MMEYGVQTHNKFAFLDEDVSDPEETLAKAEQEKKKAALVPQPKKTVVIKSPVVVKPLAAKEIEKQPRKDFGDHQAKPPMKPRNDRDRDGGGMHRDRGSGGGGGGQGRGGGGYPRQQRRPQNEQNEGTDALNDKPKRMPNGRPPRNDYNKEGAGDRDGHGHPHPPRRVGPREAGGGGGRGFGGGGSGGPRGPRRPRSDQGQGENKTEENKPKENEDKPEENQVDNFSNEAEPPKANDENVENAGELDKVPKEGDENEEEQVPRGKTLEEYKAELNQKAAEAFQFNTRKPGEGGDAKIYQKLVPLKKPEKTTKDEEQDESNLHLPKEKREKTLPFDVAFADKRSAGRTGFGTDRNERPLPRGDRQGQGGGQQGSGGGRGGFGGGPRGPPRNNFGPGGAGGQGPSNRRPPGKQNQGAGGFTLENDQFPALGAQ